MLPSEMIAEYIRRVLQGKEETSGLGTPDNRSDDIHEIAPDGGAVVSPGSDGIDGWCERINTGGR